MYTILGLKRGLRFGFWQCVCGMCVSMLTLEHALTLACTHEVGMSALERDVVQETAPAPGTIQLFGTSFGLGNLQTTSLRNKGSQLFFRVWL